MGKVICNPIQSDGASVGIVARGVEGGCAIETVGLEDDARIVEYAAGTASARDRLRSAKTNEGVEVRDERRGFVRDRSLLALSMAAAIIICPTWQ